MKPLIVILLAFALSYPAYAGNRDHQDESGLVDKATGERPIGPEEPEAPDDFDHGNDGQEPDEIAYEEPEPEIPAEDPIAPEDAGIDWGWNE